jgi:hypothetical protein
MITSYEKHVDAPLEIVFDTASDVGAMPQFTRDVEEMVFLSPAPLQLDSQVIDTRRLLGVRRSQVISIPIFERPARFVARFAIFGVAFESDHLFYETKNGTRLLITVDTVGAVGVGRILRLFVPLVAAVVQYGIRREIEDIKIEAEHRAKNA